MGHKPKGLWSIFLSYFLRWEKYTQIIRKQKGNMELTKNNIKQKNI